MAQPMPPLPYKTPVVDETGFFTDPWAKWFRQLFVRIGGVDALSNTELASLPALELAAVSANISALQASLSNLQGQVKDLDQGRVL